MGQALIKTRTCIVFPPSFTAILHSVYQQHQLAFPIMSAEQLHAQYLCLFVYHRVMLGKSWRKVLKADLTAGILNKRTLIQTH